MSNRRTTTLREIAEATGVSRMAVSLALRGKQGVSASTRRKVLKAAERLGYEPDPDVAKLMAHIRSRSTQETQACLALLTSGPKPDHWKKFRTERKYVEGAIARARAYGYRVEPFWLNDPRMPLHRLGNIIWNRGIEGMVVAPLLARLSGEDERAVRLDFARFAAVEISETVNAPNLDRSMHDQYTSMLACFHELKQLGYTSIGFVIEEAMDFRVNGKWTAAFLYARHRTTGISAPPPLMLKSADQKIFDAWYEDHEPDVVIGVGDYGLRLLRDRGLRVPEEVGYATLDLDGVQEEFGAVSGIDQNSELVGAAAVDILVAAIQRGQKGVPEHPQRTQIEGTWVEGKTTRRQEV